MLASPRDERIPQSGLTLRRGRTVAAPFVVECPAHLECHLYQTIAFPKARSSSSERSPRSPWKKPALLTNCLSATTPLTRSSSSRAAGTRRSASHDKPRTLSRRTDHSSLPAATSEPKVLKRCQGGRLDGWVLSGPGTGRSGWGSEGDLQEAITACGEHKSGGRGQPLIPGCRSLTVHERGLRDPGRAVAMSLPAGPGAHPASRPRVAQATTCQTRWARAPRPTPAGWRTGRSAWPARVSPFRARRALLVSTGASHRWPARGDRRLDP